MMKRRNIVSYCLMVLIVFSQSLGAQTREVIDLKSGWKFKKGSMKEATQTNFDDAAWETVNVPHDWAIFGPFDKDIDKQVVAITQNQEKVATEKTGRTGALPHIGEAWYRKVVELSDEQAQKKALIVFEGAMSQPVVYLNGKEVGQWAYGYSYFYFDISDMIKPGRNTVAVYLNNPKMSSRWYPGAGLFRKVRIILKNEESIDQWGTYVTTPIVTEEMAQVNIKTNVSGKNLSLLTTIRNAAGELIVSDKTSVLFGNVFEQNLAVPEPQLWSPETPILYTVVSQLFVDGQMSDELVTRFGIRTIAYESGVGFSLNGEVRKFKGVCLHHDLGPLGSAVNRSALRRQLQILKDMGCDAVRSAHNMPSVEQLELCDEMGFLFMAESFDEWAVPKVLNGYSHHFNEYAERDVVNLVRVSRNHPCVVMYSAGNEVVDQWQAEGVKRAKYLQEIFHREDPTRPVTVGMDQVKAVMENGFGATMDVPGLNYRLPLYQEAYDKFPQGFLLGSETASTVSSRGVYKFPVEAGKMKMYDDVQCSSYDLECCRWSNLPDDDFIWQDDYDWVIGEFVWTGFDYLGEPTPYDDYWPTRSSYFGICDLAGLPKDRYYLYRSRWNVVDETLHILPHWNWPGREGENTPVFVYTSYDSAELFVNGKSKGVQHKHDDTPQNRYRLMWMDVQYEPGTVKVVAYDTNGKIAKEKTIHTAGKADRLVLEADRTHLKADGDDIAFVTVSVVDKNGVACPTATNQLSFEVTGAGGYRAACNGDATSLEMFHLPTMKLFSGKLVVLVQSSKQSGAITLEVKGKGLITGKLTLTSQD